MFVLSYCMHSKFNLTDKSVYHLAVDTINSPRICTSIRIAPNK